MLLAQREGLLDPERARQALQGPGEVAEGLVSAGDIPQAAAERLLARLWELVFACPSCSRRWGYEELTDLATLHCAGCGAPLRVEERSPAERSATLSVQAEERERRDATLQLSLGTGAPASPQLLAGSARPRSIGPYHLERELGRGAHGVVFLARREGLDGRFALKVLLRGGERPRELERFRLEAQVASKLDHEGIVAVFDVGLDGPHHYYAMEYVAGLTLRDRLRDGPLPPVEAARLVARVAAAVGHAHAHGVLHRDLKPGNIILDERDGQPRITDFGLARDRSLAESLTRSGDVLGTPGYMAPEQLAAGRTVDARVDVYALGVLLYECLAGRVPYPAATLVELNAAIRRGVPRPLRELRPEVPEELDAIASRALAREPAARYPQAGDLAGALGDWLAEQDERPAPPPPPPSPGGRRCGVLLGGVLLVGAVLGAAFLVQSPPPPSPDPTPSPAPAASPRSTPTPLPSATPPAVRDWAFLYYMSYDNSLGQRTGRQILDMLQEGLVNERAVALVLADFEDSGGLRRFVLTHEGESVEVLPGEGSGEEETLAAFLDWAAAAHPARKVALAFLNHGGDLDEICVDENPGRPEGQRSLKIDEVGPIVAAWRERIPGEVELVFLQQPLRGSLEIFYCFRDAARVVMATQHRLGAPNYYYAGALREACQYPRLSGERLARVIATHDRPEMFQALTALDSRRLRSLGPRLNAALQPLLAAETLQGLELGPPPGLGHRVDALAWLGGLYAQSQLDPAPYQAFARWVEDELLALRFVSTQATEAARRACGFSLFIPADAASAERFGHLPIYADTALDELQARLRGE